MGSFFNLMFEVICGLNCVKGNKTGTEHGALEMTGDDKIIVIVIILLIRLRWFHKASNMHNWSYKPNSIILFNNNLMLTFTYLAHTKNSIKFFEN